MYTHVPSGLNLTFYRAYNSDLGRWLNRDPLGEQGGINHYAYADNKPINEVDPLGLWGIAFGNNSGSSYFNLGIGNPSLYFSPSSLSDAGQGAEAFADGINPFGNPFANNGYYDPCDSALQDSRHIGTVTGIAELSIIGIVGAGVLLDAIAADTIAASADESLVFLQAAQDSAGASSQAYLEAQAELDAELLGTENYSAAAQELVEAEQAEAAEYANLATAQQEYLAAQARAAAAAANASKLGL
jgi:RHS repeat-associated protein